MGYRGFQLGKFLGGMIILLFMLAALNYPVKFINKKFRNYFKKHEKIQQIFMKFMRFIVKNHRLFGKSTIAALLLHFLIQFNNYGFSPTGGFAASILILQVALGFYGSKTKKTGGIWLIMHRTVALVLFVAIGIHVN